MAKEQLAKYYTQFPYKGKRYVLYCRKGREGLLVQTFAACYAARRFLDLMLRGEEVVYERTTKLKTNSGIEIKCGYLEEILDHEYSELEAEWELPAQYVSAIYFFKHRRHPQKKQPANPIDPPKEQSGVEKPPPAPKRKRRPRKSRGGMVTAAMIADDIGVSPRIVRGALRSAKIEKPEGGWMWPPSQAIKITRTIKKRIK